MKVADAASGRNSPGTAGVTSCGAGGGGGQGVNVQREKERAASACMRRHQAFALAPVGVNVHRCTTSKQAGEHSTDFIDGDELEVKCN